jgi:two-component system response regulator
MNPKLNILLLEDEENDAFMMCHALKSEGIQVPIHICNDGFDGIAYLAGEGRYADRAQHPYPAMIISDLKMPGASGFDILEWLRANPHLMVIPFIVWSSSGDEADVKHAYCLGANGYICKPTDFNELKGTVADVFRYWAHCLIRKIGGQTCEEVRGRTFMV